MTDEPQFRDPGELPSFDLVDKNLIDVDAGYQRELDARRVQKILADFNWRNFGALILAPAADGRYHVTDGQHRLAAALRHPMVDVVPSIIVPVEGQADEAGVFVGVNKARKNVSKLQLFHAELAAGDVDAVTIKQVCDRAKVTICRYASLRYQPSETIAVSAIAALIDGRGAMRAREVLEIVAKAALAPIKGEHIRAAELLLTDPEFRNEVDPEALTESLSGNEDQIADEARAFARTHRLPVTRAFASVWFRKTRKRRRAAA